MSDKLKTLWKKVKDKNVKHVWKCSEGGSYECEVTPDWYEQNGTPVCPDCDNDCEYVRTEVKTTGYRFCK